LIINKLEKIYFAELVLFFFILRWVFIVGLGDWPDDITFGFFQKTDNILFKDFFFGYLNPVNFNILNFFLLISPFNDFFDVNLVIWIIWITNIYVTLKILKNLNIYIDFKTKLLIYFLFIALYSPVNTNFIFFNYFSNLLSSLTLLFTIGYLKNQNISQIIFLSIICSLSILVKVNVGLAIFTLTLLIIFIFSQKKLFHSIIFLLLTIFFVLAVCFITSDDYFANILKIIFVSPSLEKGGFFTIFLRSLPRISFTFENQKYLKELLISVFILYPLIFITFIKLINLKNLKLKSNNNFEISDLYIYIFSSIFIFLLFFTFFEIKNSDVLFDFFLNLNLISLTEFNNHLFYSLLYIFSLILIFSLVIQNKNILISYDFIKNNMFLLILISFAFINLKSLGAGGRYSVTYSVSFYIILIFYLSKINIFKKSFFNFIYVFSIFYFLSWNILPNQLSTFTSFYKLPNNEFPNIYVPYGSHSFIQKPHLGENKFFENLSTIIEKNVEKDKTFLWMGGGFPGFFKVNHYFPTLVPSLPPHLKSDINFFVKNIRDKKPYYIALDTNKKNWDWNNIKRYTGEDLRYENFFIWIDENYLILDQIKVDSYSLTIFELK
tara:strand:+ start:428 stop:2248 length:1821 start_codon:yes stop_codon:yes gene_type:complete